ncbi:unnamed protein product [Chrysoparadoxa australica]
MGNRKQKKRAPRRKDSGLTNIVATAVILVLAFCWSKYDQRVTLAREQPRESDVFVVSYPKSGNNWLRFILAHAHSYSNGTAESPHWRKEWDFNSIETVIPDLEYGPNRYEYYTFGAPHLFKSHQPYAPEAVHGDCANSVGTMDSHQCSCPNCPPKWKRVLYLVRDGRDTMCSYFHFQKGLGLLDWEVTFEDFLTMERYPGYNWSKHVASYLSLAADPSVDLMVIKYEDLKQEPEATVAKVLDWVGISHTGQSIQRALEASSFERMRHKEEASGLRLFDAEYPNRDKSWRMTRKGSSGGWNECFTSAASKKLWNEQALDVMKQLGYADGEDW